MDIGSGHRSIDLRYRLSMGVEITMDRIMADLIAQDQSAPDPIASLSITVDEMMLPKGPHPFPEAFYDRFGHRTMGKLSIAVGTIMNTNGGFVVSDSIAKFRHVTILVLELNRYFVTAMAPNLLHIIASFPRLFRLDLRMPMFGPLVMDTPFERLEELRVYMAADIDFTEAVLDSLSNTLHWLEIRSTPKRQLPPIWFEKLRKLRHLDLDNWRNLESVPATLRFCTSLGSLAIQGSKLVDTLPDVFNHLGRLRDCFLNINLKELPRSLQYLQLDARITVTGSQPMKSIPAELLPRLQHRDSLVVPLPMVNPREIDIKILSIIPPSLLDIAAMTSTQQRGSEAQYREAQIPEGIIAVCSCCLYMRFCVLRFPSTSKKPCNIDV